MGSGNRVINGYDRNKEWHDVVERESGFLYKKLVNGVSRIKALEIEKTFCEQYGWENITNVSPEERSSALSKSLTKWNKETKGIPVTFNGVKYASFREAEKLSGVSRYKIKKLWDSENT